MTCLPRLDRSARLRTAAGAALAASALLLAACGSAPWSASPTSSASASGGRYFQYVGADGRVVGEYLTPDAATCSQHLANLRRGNAHGNDATRCSATSAAAGLPVSAAATDGQNVSYSFRFASLEQCQRMMGALGHGATVTAACR